MTVLTLQEDLLSPTLTAQHDDSDGTRVPRVFTNNRILSLDDNDVVLDHVHDAAVPHSLALGHGAGVVLVFDGHSLLGGQETHDHAFIRVRQYTIEYRPAPCVTRNATRPRRSL